MEKPWKVIAAFVGVFIAGAVFGAFFSLGIGLPLMERRSAASDTAVLPLPTPHPVARKGPPGAHWPASQAMQAAQLIRRLTARLELTPDQRQRIMPLIQRAVEDFRWQQANYFREDAFILVRLQHDIARELAPEQRRRLFELEKRQRELIRRRKAELKEYERLNGHPTPPAVTHPAPAHPGSGAPSSTPGGPEASPAKNGE